MYDGVLCCALSLYFSLSNTIHTDDKCFFARVIDGYVSRISDLLCIRFKVLLKRNFLFHKYVVQVFLSQIAYPFS